jgi:ribose transport system permease protein
VFILASVTALRVLNGTGSIALSIAAALGVGIAAGLVNGVVVAVAGVNSFIGTLATSFALFGLSYIVSQQSILTTTHTSFANVARTQIAGVTMSSWIAIAFVLVLWFVLVKMRFGRHIFAVGTNPEAARLSGVRVVGVQVATFALSGFAAALAGLLATARVLTAQASDDYSLIFIVITAVVVGGTSISGGVGGVWRTIFGVFFIAFLDNGFNLLGVDPIYQRLIRGAIILVAVWVDARSRSQGGSHRRFRRAGRLSTALVDDRRRQS